MEIDSFAGAVGHAVNGPEGRFVLSPLANVPEASRLVCMHLAPGGTVGEHEAVGSQLFCVVDGEGWVSGDDATRRPVHPMEAAYWRPGERHAAGTESGMVAVILEAVDVEIRATPLL